MVVLELQLILSGFILLLPQMQDLTKQFVAEPLLLLAVREALPAHWEHRLTYMHGTMAQQR